MALQLALRTYNPAPTVKEEDEDEESTGASRALRSLPLPQLAKWDDGTSDALKASGSLTAAALAGLRGDAGLLNPATWCTSSRRNVAPWRSGVAGPKLSRQPSKGVGLALAEAKEGPEREQGGKSAREKAVPQPAGGHAGG